MLQVLIEFPDWLFLSWNCCFVQHDSCNNMYSYLWHCLFPLSYYRSHESSKLTIMCNKPPTVNFHVHLVFWIGFSCLQWPNSQQRLLETGPDALLHLHHPNQVLPMPLSRRWVIVIVFITSQSPWNVRLNRLRFNEALAFILIDRGQN